MKNEGGPSRHYLGGVWQSTASSVHFLSRLPVGSLTPDAAPDFRATSHAFPLAGIIIAIPAALVLVTGSHLGISAVVAVILSVSTMIIVTGALHEDGLADVADGFWGGHTRERKLEIMRDSAIGTYGTIALILTISLRIALLSALYSQLNAYATAVILVATASCSRLAMLAPWTTLEPARSGDGGQETGQQDGKKPSSGLSARFGAPARNSFWVAMALGVPAFLAIWFTVGIVAVVVAALFWQLCIMGVSALSKKHIGGHTGDVLGATQQISELGLYIGLLVAI